ncbi:MAG: primosomal protein N' [Bacillus sp. (in: Bacteria)]|nr:primosomal protein N' [Bacillus sp. (in: firmicutes)]MCM1427962.1 primosomal protein N' [Eubacterium sp.]
MSEQYADVIIDISHEKVDRPFQYRIPNELSDKIVPGIRVHVPFGKGNKDMTGYVVELSDKTDYPQDKIKEIRCIDEKATTLESDLIQTAYWMKSHYGSTMITALKTTLPVKQKLKRPEKKKIVRCCSEEEIKEQIEKCAMKKQRAKVRVLEALQEEEILPYALLREKLNVAAPTLHSLEKQGIISIETESYYRNPVKRISAKEAARPLSEEQNFIIGDIVKDYREGKPGTYLIHGITGSGKTEVYMGIIEKMIAMGRQAIVLIPEIALTYQTLLRFYKRFGDRVSVMNSTLSMGEKYDQMERARRGELDVIIGPRSALFTPFPKLGVIVMDEEHENSYKSESMPKYHARETAIQIASVKGASVVLGSATPSLEAYYRAGKGEYKLYRLKRRLSGGCLPQVYTVDLRKELQEGNRSIFSRKLKSLLEERLMAGEQSMLFLNRRGYAGFISCRACGHVMKCPHCDVSLSEHRNGMLVCHYCGYEERRAKNCPVCGSPYLLGFKAGTEQIEEAIYKEFPGARVLRMDADSTRSKESYEKILSAFADGRADILVGTQMIVKGHDFPNVTLVGILAADLSLNQNDYRAGERTFQLLTQAAGRAGRGTKAGEVVIQTYQPEHYSIVHAANQDYESFYAEEIMYRELLQYPPAAHMLAVLLLSREKEEGEVLLERFCGLIRKYFTEEKEPYIIGPAQAAISKINDWYRHTLYLKHADYENLVKIKDMMEEYAKEQNLKNVTIQFDFDPMTTY